jgi:phosphoglycerate dehydrogenase-like enzyme
MNHLLAIILLSILTLPSTNAAMAGVGPTPEAIRIIEEFNLREAATPIARHPNWHPQRVVVSLPAGLSTMLPDLERQLRDTAGEVELVIDRSENFILSAEVLAGTDAIIGVCSPPTMNNAAPRLLWLHNYYVGVDRCIGLPEDQIEGRVFTNSKRLSGPAIAQHSIAMMLSLARGLPAYQRTQAANKWDRSPAGRVQFGETKGKTVLIVGLGGIGTQVAWRAHGLGMRVIATRNSSRQGPDYVDYVGLADELLTLAAEADVVVNTLPLTSKTTGIFDQGFFDKVKSGAIFISVGRGKSTVTADLVAALESGKLYGAGLDVTDPEPLPKDSPLWQMENVIITPHVSAAGPGSLQRVAAITVENLRRYLAGEPLLNIVDMRAGY